MNTQIIPSGASRSRSFKPLPKGEGCPLPVAFAPTRRVCPTAFAARCPCATAARMAAPLGSLTSGAPRFGPWDPDTTIVDFFSETIAMVYDDPEMAAQLRAAIALLQRRLRVIDVGGLMDVFIVSIQSVYIEAFGPTAMPGMVRLTEKYLGSRGAPHAFPKVAPDQLSTRHPDMADAVKPQFGRNDAGPQNNAKNFADALRSSSLSADQFVFSENLMRWLAAHGGQFNKVNLATDRHVQMAVKKMAQALITDLGVSPVPTFLLWHV